MVEFKDRLELALSMRGIRPSDLSRMTGIGEGAISQYRNGKYKASQRNLEKISKALNVSISWLMGISDESCPPALASVPETNEGSNLKPEEMLLVSLYRKLNPEGREKLLDYADDLVSSGKYIKNDPSELGQKQA